jgi:hypothetical protein
MILGARAVIVIESLRARGSCDHAEMADQARMERCIKADQVVTNFRQVTSFRDVRCARSLPQSPFPFPPSRLLS